MTSTTTTALPTTFAPRWVTAMLTTVLGTSAGGGAATSLGELDRQAGDGDFGTNLTSAFTRVQDEIQATSPQTFASWLTAVFQYDAAARAMAAVPASSAASDGWSRGHFEDMNTWFNALMADSFG